MLDVNYINKDFNVQFFLENSRIGFLDSIYDFK